MMTVSPLCRISLDVRAVPFMVRTCVPLTWKLKSPGWALPPKLLFTTFTKVNCGLCLLVKVQVASCWRAVLMLKLTEPEPGAFTTGGIGLTVNGETGGAPILAH